MICIDSDCIIDFLKGKEKAVKIIEQYKEEVMTTEISIFEILFGIYIKKDINEKEQFAAKEFFDSITVFPFDSECGEISAKILTFLIKKGMRIEQNDCFISSIMIKNGCERIITRNKEHFSRIKDIHVISY